MNKLLNGSDVAGFIKERQAKQVRQLKANKIQPKLAIVQTKDDLVIDTYVNLKQKYGQDIDAIVEIHKIDQAQAADLVTKLNKDADISGIIIQLPLQKTSQTEELINLVQSEKDVDALREKSKFTPATATAILWLLSAYNIELRGKKILIIGRGKLVGSPLEKMLISSGIEPMVVDSTETNLKVKTLDAEIIISAANAAGILHSEMLNPNTVIIDAATVSENGKISGNISPEVYERDDLILTPQKGGVGPLTVCALFDNLILAAQKGL